MDSLTSGLTGLSAQTLNAGDIVIEYHPHSERDTRILSPEEFKASLSDDSEPAKPPDDEPWRPFHSREDFEFAELVRDAALNRTQIDRLIKLVQHYQDTPGSFAFRGYDDLKTSLENASKLLTPVTAFVACAGFTSAYPVFSFSVTISILNLRVKKKHTKLGVVHSGTGSWTTLLTRRSCGILSGTHRRFFGMTEITIHKSTRNHGLESASGTFR